MLAALHHQEPDRAPAPSVDWEGYIAGLYDDREAEFTRGAAKALRTPPSDEWASLRG
jgi:hypothetical protein